MFSEFLSFCSQGGEGEGVKIEKCPECYGKPKNALTFFSDYTPFYQVGGGGGGGPKFWVSISPIIFIISTSNFNML